MTGFGDVAAAVDVALESVKLGAIFRFVPFVGNSSLHHSVLYASHSLHLERTRPCSHICDPPHFLH